VERDGGRVKGGKKRDEGACGVERRRIQKRGVREEGEERRSEERDQCNIPSQMVDRLPHRSVPDTDSPALHVIDNIQDSDPRPRHYSPMNEMVKFYNSRCANCSKPAPNRKCARCKGVVYCNAQYQRCGWPHHKTFCATTRTIRLALDKSDDDGAVLATRHGPAGKRTITWVVRRCMPSSTRSLFYHANRPDPWYGECPGQ
jgi:hypothetical protein